MLLKVVLKDTGGRNEGRKPSAVFTAMKSVVFGSPNLGLAVTTLSCSNRACCPEEACGELVCLKYGEMMFALGCLPRQRHLLSQ